ncbi:hypothetical protein [Streptomyces longwoodensis]|uniref:hypothetical protein n=1 Tax=Streptomyces longwoodensis TaxID=68231 RepID=UPI002251F2AF|nr:hypothetical protein [Streptomyces longwoodensis]MCX5000951.1 hypothetical protein [Streptomyces longwoodensis]
MAQAVEAPASVTAEGPTSHTQNQGLELLRVPFPKEQISPLPKIICGECSRSRTKVCENPRHAKSKCKICDNYITQAHMHLDYVGHAELTNRLLEADPLWSWEPVAFDAQGLPAFDSNGGLWIRLTVCGHTRLGYGDSQGKSGPNAVKEAIGDALRNAAMRFGAALDLWAKSDLREAQTLHPKSAEDDGYVSATGQPSASRQDRPSPVPAGPSAHLAKLMAQTTDCWNGPVGVLEQIKADGETHKVLDEQFVAKDGTQATLRAVLDGRIAELRQAANERSAA